MAKAIKKPAKKRFNFEIYELTTTNALNELIKFEIIAEEEKVKYIPVSVDDNPVHIIGKSRKGKFIFGTFAHVQMYELPNGFDIVAQKPVLLELEKNVGFGHYTSFLFDTDLQMIIYESNKNGVSLGLFCDFFEKNYKIPPIETRVVVDPKELQKLAKMQYIKRFSIKVAKVRNGSVFKAKKKEGVGEVIDLAKKINANALECTMFSGRKKENSLDLGLVKNMLGELLKVNNKKEVPTLFITGKESAEDKTDFINFVSNKIVLTIEMDRQRFTNLQLQPKYDLIEEKYLEIRPSLIEAYKPKEN